MKLEVLKCPSCGANIEFTEEIESCECEYCGAKVTKSSVRNGSNNNSSIKNTGASSLPNVNKVNIKKVKSSVDKSVRKGITFVLNALFIVSLIFAGILLISTISTAEYDMLIGVIFCLIYAAMFKVLALTPKGSKYILGKQKGLKPIYFVIICIFLSFMLIICSPTDDTAVDENTDNVITTEQIAIETQINA